MPPEMPASWSATVLLHPFSPPQSTDPNPQTPFFELCIATFRYVRDVYFSAQILGCTSGKVWLYIVRPNDETLYWNGLRFIRVDDIGWSIPKNWFGDNISKAVCCGSSPLNWMNQRPVDWWRAPVPNTKPPAATWMWFDSVSGVPVRMMFGDGPAKGPNMGDPTQLAILQMYSFSYFATFNSNPELPRTIDDLLQLLLRAIRPSIEGFTVGNPLGYQNFVWNGNFGMTVFMTPVNENFAPLPTRVLYVWKPDERYSVYSDRAQSTLMSYRYNQGDKIPQEQEALLTGPAPAGVKPPSDSDASFLIDYYNDDRTACIGPKEFDFPQEPPSWVSIPAVQGKIQATVVNNPVLSPKTTVTIFSVLFPPSPPNYPDSTYLWTWYAPQNATGTQSRPITFMQSQSGVNLGTSLALADYFYYKNFDQPIDRANFIIPPQCRAVSTDPIPSSRGHGRPVSRRHTTFLSS